MIFFCGTISTAIKLKVSTHPRNVAIIYSGDVIAVYISAKEELSISLLTYEKAVLHVIFVRE